MRGPAPRASWRASPTWELALSIPRLSLALEGASAESAEAVFKQAGQQAPRPPHGSCRP